MSKNYDNTIPIFMAPKPLRKKVMRIVTDSKTVEEPKDPNTCHVFKLFSLFASAEQIANLKAAYLKGGMGYGHAKEALFQLLQETFEPKRERYDAYMADTGKLDRILLEGADVARQKAIQTLKRVKKHIL